ncbi:hypothetical protein GQR58_011603 [Nymphon striatum]|nr:hypothetical protein GQR58_011603 [Nymphon striatum]
MSAPLTLSAFKNGINVQLAKILGPNNGLSSYSQFFEAINCALNYYPTLDNVLDKVVMYLQASNFECIDADKARRLHFIIRQLELLSHKKFSTADFCFALGSFPRCSYDQLRDCLVLPSPSKLHSIISNSDLDTLLQKTFRKVNEKQKKLFLIIDEVKIRPSVSFSGGVLSGMAKNDENSKATSMLCVMMKCLHGGPSVMVSVTPVNKLTGVYQFNVVKEVAAAVEKAGGVVIGSITDNHKLNQHYCKQFTLLSNCTAVHPFDKERVWFLLFDTVHLLKCIRNNWLTEKCHRLSLDGEIVGSFSDVQNLYESEKDSILKLHIFRIESGKSEKEIWMRIGKATSALTTNVKAMSPQFPAVGHPEQYYNRPLFIRVFSNMKLVKSDWRSVLKSKNLSDQLMVILATNDIDQYDPLPAIRLWNSAGSKPRRPCTAPYGVRSCNADLESDNECNSELSDYDDERDI